MPKMDELFRMMKEQGASDCHITAGQPPIFRLHGEIKRLDRPALDAKACQDIVFEILTDKQKKELVEKWELDCSYALEGVARYRVNVCIENGGVGAVFRIIPQDMPTVEQLNLPEALVDLVSIPKGLVLVTGPTGSGKSTTLAALINWINHNTHKHIITIEDPIEFVHPNVNCVVHQREIGAHSKSFSNALKASFRECPDIVLVGEMRDLETIGLAITAAESGNLVFGTLHTNSAAKTVDRIIDVFPAEQQAQIRTMLAESLRGVVAQTLFKRADRSGRVAAIEIMLVNNAISNLIREGKTHQIPSSMQTGVQEGMQTFKAEITKLVREGKISKEDGETFLGEPITASKSNKMAAAAQEEEKKNEAA